MVRLLGALLVAGACSWLGFSRAAQLRRNVTTLDEMESGFTLLLQRLELGLSLPRLLAELAERTDGPARELFGFCAHALNQTDREAFSCLWRRGVENLQTMGCAEKNALLPLGETLGQCDLEEQKRGIRAVLERLEDFRLRAEETARRQGQVYRMLGLSGGAFLVILLL